jgi:hypothetical protein
MRSARGRIVGWMLVLVALALLGSVAVASRALSERADTLAQNELAHEAEKFRAFGASQVASEYGTVDALLSRYLIDNRPDSYEAFFSSSTAGPTDAAGTCRTAAWTSRQRSSPRSPTRRPQRPAGRTAQPDRSGTSASP